MHTLTTKRLEGSARVGDAPTAPNSSSMHGGRRRRNCSMPTIPGFPGNGTRPDRRGGRGGASCVLGCSRGGPGRRLFDVDGSLGFGSRSGQMGTRERETSRGERIRRRELAKGGGLLALESTRRRAGSWSSRSTLCRDHVATASEDGDDREHFVPRSLPFCFSSLRVLFPFHFLCFN